MSEQMENDLLDNHQWHVWSCGSDAASRTPVEALRLQLHSSGKAELAGAT